jgi:hypothetical protein
MSVTLCVAQGSALRFIPGDAHALEGVQRVERRDAPAGTAQAAVEQLMARGSNSVPESRRARPLALDAGGGFTLADDADAARCAEIVLGADELAREGDRLGRKLGRSWLLSPDLWLWRPERLRATDRATLRWWADGVEDRPPSLTFAAVGGTGWQPLDVSAFRWLGYGVFGEFERVRLEGLATADGGTDGVVDVAVLDAPRRASREGIVALIQEGIRGVAAVYGGMPVDRLQVVVMPVAWGGDPVPFGLVGRGGGHVVLLLLGADVPDEQLLGDWDALHEFQHLGMPYVDDKWMSEGFASYYTEVARLRLGYGDEAEYWRRLEAGYERGRRQRARGTLDDASKAMHEQGAYQRVYWGGAMVALALDLELRRESGGTLTLDDAMRALRDRYRGTTRKVTADEALEALDEWHGSSLFTRTAPPLLHLPYPPPPRSFRTSGALDPAENARFYPVEAGR